MKSICLVIVYVLTIMSLQAQNVKKVTFTGHQSNLKSADPRLYQLSVDTLATSIVIGIDKKDQFKGAFVVVKSDTIFLTADDEREGESEQVFSNLISLSSHPEEIFFYPANIKNTVTFYFIDARMTSGQEIKAEVKKKSAGCSVPEMIEQSEWRTGLPDPNYDRINQKVLHVIIHHTAGSNTDTNYTQTVRDIYVYHTQVRGWSDIGYNYLIAPNGTIYKGRDPGIYDQDNVMGAHFCNNNSGTMGISMMGTYTDIVPSDTAFQSLIALITWKLGKEQLDPMGFYYQALNPELPAIAGHRDGCSTECPGNALYAEMDSIRNEVLKDFDGCSYTITSLSDPVYRDDQINIRYVDGFIRISSVSELETIEIYNMLGQQFLKDISVKGKFDTEVALQGVNKGMYIVRCRTQTGWASAKIVI